MSRSLPQPPLSSMPLPALQAMANDIGDIDSLTPRAWFDRARHEADLAVLAERKAKKEDMFLAYTRACGSYTNVKMHVGYGEAKKMDPQWAERVKKFKETYEIFLKKAKEIKDELKQRDIEGGKSSTASRPGPSRNPSGPEVTSMGSIADRMKALNVHGMDVGSSSKRFSSGPSSTPAPSAPSSRPAAQTSATSTISSPILPNGAMPTGGASAGSNLGSLRTTNNRPRSGSGASTSTSSNINGTSTNGVNAQLSRSPPTPRDDKVNLPIIKQSATGSSGRSRRSTNPTEVDRPLPTAPNNVLKPNNASQRLSSPTSPAAQPPFAPSHPNGPSQPLPTIGAKPAPQPAAGPSSHGPMSVPHSLSRRDLAALEQQPDPDTSSNTLKDFEMAFPSLTDFGRQWDHDEELTEEEIKANLKIAQWSSSVDHQQLSRNGDKLPNGTAKDNNQQPTIREDADRTEITLPDVPSFPTLPSAPLGRPGLPNLPHPPARADTANPPTRQESSDTPDHKALSPPVPEPGAGMTRPASVPNVATLPGDVDLLSDEPVLEGDRDKHPSRPSAPVSTSRPSVPNGVVRDSQPTIGGLSFPVAVPTPGNSHAQALQPTRPSTRSSPQAQAQQPKQPVQKPKFPFSNSVTPDELRSYLLNPAVDLLILDVRNEDEYQRGQVGREYEARGAKVNVVWLDPTVLLRDGMNSQKLEDSLSLSPEPQRRAFEKRHTFDLVVVYDAKSSSWPTKGAPPTPVSRLWNMIYEAEFTKKLDRTPVMLVGGYDAWREFIKMRAMTHAKAHAEAQAQAQAVHAHGHGHGHSQSLAMNGNGRPYNPKTNGHTSNVPSPRGPDRYMSPSSSGDFSSKRANRDKPIYQSAQYAKNITDSFGYSPQSMTGEPPSYTGQQPSRSYVNSSSSSHNRTPSNYASPSTTIAPPPQASIHPGPGSRRRSDYMDHSTQAYSGGGVGSGYTPTASPRPAIDYPQAHALAMVPQPPPAAVNPMDRYDTRPAVVRSGSIRGLDLVAREGDEVRYWNDVVLGLTGLKNLGNTCYMNSTLQCLSATYPFTSLFLDGSFKRMINVYNPLGTKGNLANAFSELLKALWKEDYTFLSPVTFRKNIITFASQFSGTDQHDSQEFLSFVLDGLHEDLNRVKHKPPPVEMTPEREAALETLPPEVASEKEWNIYKMRNDSFIVDLFQGQYRNRLECLTCRKTSTTYDAFMYVSLPVPAGKKGVVLQELIDEFVKSEVMENEDAWNCPRCKVPRRATKTLSIARLPPVLLIQLKRFSTKNGVFWDKSETPVIFPVNGLDLTRYVPYRQRTGREDMDDPRTQVGPFKYDLYGVSNHMGTLSSGHYTAYVKSAKGWQYAEDSRITKAQEKDVVSRPAYILFYKRVKA